MHHSGGARSSVPVFVNLGRGTVLWARSFLRTARTPSLPAIHSVRGTVLCARFRPPREGHGPLCHRQDCLCHSAERKRTLWEGHRPRCPEECWHRGDAVPPIRPSGSGAVLGARFRERREGHSPLCPFTLSREGRSPLRPLILADREDAVPPIAPFGRGTVPCATGRIACATQQSENAPSGRGTVLCATGRIACATLQSENAPSGRGAVLRACQFCGPRGRGPSQCTIREGHGPLCHRQDCLCHRAERKRTLWEGHGPPCLPILRTARTPSLPLHHSGGAPSPVPQAGLPVPLSGARTHPLGGAQSSAPANPCLRACQFLRTARTPSLPFHHSGGPQSPVPQAGLPVPLGRAKTHPGGGAQSSGPANSCGPRGRGPSHCTIQGGAPSPVPQAGLPVPLCRAKTHPLGGAQPFAPVFVTPGRGAVLCARKSLPPCPPDFADREDAVPPIAPFGRGTVLCATGRIACATQQSENAPSGRGTVLCARLPYPGRGTVLCATGRIACATLQSENAPSGRGTVLGARKNVGTAVTRSLPSGPLGVAPSSAPVFVNAGRGTVLCARLPYPGRGAVPCAR
jgi:hypothetical protein